MRGAAVRNSPAEQTLHIPNMDSATWRSVRMNLRPRNLPRFFVCQLLGSGFSGAAWSGGVSIIANIDITAAENF